MKKVYYLAAKYALSLQREGKDIYEACKQYGINRRELIQAMENVRSEKHEKKLH